MMSRIALLLCVLCASGAATGSTSTPEHKTEPPRSPAAIPTPATNAPAKPERKGLPSEPEASPDDLARSLLALAESMATRGDDESAEIAYNEVLNAPVDDAIIQTALLAYADFLRKTHRDTRAAAIYEKYLAAFPANPRSTSVLIDLGRTLRDMGAFNLALARFYAVLNSALAVSPENIERYRDLAQLAKFEIAETYYQQGDYTAAGKYFGRIKLLDLPPSDRARASFREAYAFFLDSKLDQAVIALRTFLDNFPHDSAAQESRYLLCLALRRLGRTQEALTETLTLLRASRSDSAADPAQWSYWQRRTGNQLANDFYEQGDFNSALTIYQTLAELRSDPAWRWPALYQIGLCYERLRQVDRAAQVYRNIIAENEAAQKAGTAVDSTTAEVGGMAEWRLGQIDWSHEVDRSVQAFTNQHAAIPAQGTNVQ